MLFTKIQPQLTELNHLGIWRYEVHIFLLTNGSKKRSDRPATCEFGVLLVWDPLLLFVQTPIEHDDFIIWPDIDDILNKFNTCLILIYSNIHGNFQKTAVFRCHVFFTIQEVISLNPEPHLQIFASRWQLSVLWAHGYLRQWMMLKSQDFYLATVKKTRVKKTWTIWRFICSKNGGKWCNSRTMVAGFSMVTTGVWDVRTSQCL